MARWNSTEEYRPPFYPRYHVHRCYETMSIHNHNKHVHLHFGTLTDYRPMYNDSSPRFRANIRLKCSNLPTLTCLEHQPKLFTKLLPCYLHLPVSKSPSHSLRLGSLVFGIKFSNESFLYTSAYLFVPLPPLPLHATHTVSESITQPPFDRGRCLYLMQSAAYMRILPHLARYLPAFGSTVSDNKPLSLLRLDLLLTNEELRVFVATNDKAQVERHGKHVRSMSLRLSSVWVIKYTIDQGP